MTRDIANYTKHCETCQFNKSRDNRIVYGPLQQMPIATHPNHIFSLDTLGGLHNYGTTRHSIHMIVDHHSRFLWAFPTKSVSTDSYITCLRNLFQINKPEILITDRNAAFLSRKFKHFLERNNVKHLLTSSHHPETNAKVERLNSTIINRLRCEYNANLKIPWTKYIPKITESYNETVHTTTGFTPKFLYYGIQPQYIEHDTVTHTPIEKARKLAIERTIKSHEHSKQLYDIKHPEPIFKEGDQVLVKTFIYPNTGKLTQRYIGPFTILKQLSPVTYEINKSNLPQRKQTEIIHSNKLKLFYPETDFLLHYSTNIENDFIVNQNSNTKSKNTNSCKVRQIVGSPEPEMIQEFVIQSVENTNLTEDWYEEVKIEGKKANMKLDTGAQCNVLPLSLAGRLNLDIQRSPVKSLISFSGHRIPVEGQSLAMCMVKNMTAYICFIISRDNTCPILGRQTCSNIGLVKRVNTCQAITQEYQELFEGIGCLKGYEYEAKFQISDMNMQVRPPRPIPLSIKERVKKELEELEDNGIIKKLNYPTPISSQMVIAKQKEKISICIDPSDINKIQQYDLRIKYKKGKELLTADLLSRDCSYEDTYLEENFEVLMTTPTNKSSYEELQALTKEDQELQELKHLILYGWPNYKSAVPESCKKYWPCRDELSTNEDLIFNGSIVFILLKWKAKILKLIHEGHQGTNSCLRRARDSIYWHGMSQDIINTVEICRTCQANQRNKTKEPMIIKEIPSLPWEIVAADIFSIKGKNYQLINNNYSGFIDFKEMKTMNSTETIESLKKWFGVHGIPSLLEIDNGPNFTSRDFKGFQKKWLFDHQTSSPLYPNINGLAERAVQTAKNLIRKCLDSGHEVELALLNFYNTPRDGLPSPAQCLFSRRTRTLLPTSTHQLEPEIQKGHTQNLRNKREKQKTHHDKTAKTTRSFKEGEKIMLKQHHREWIPARVTQEVAPRSYKVQTPTAEYRRNSSFMRHTNLKSPKQQRRRIPEIPKSTLPEGPGPSGDKEQAQVPEELNTSPRPFTGQEPRSYHLNAEHKNGTLSITTRMVETRSGKMQDPAQERIKAEESAKPQLGATIGGDASSDPVVLNPNIDIPKYDGTEDPRPWIESLEEIGSLYHWADYIIARYAAMNMTGSAKTWLNLHKASFTSWENIKIRLIQDFSLDANKEELRMKLNRMQHWNEPAIRFAEDILVLCNKVDPAMEEETKIDHVIGGLKKEYSFALYLNPPKTTDELLVVCKKMDSFEKKYRERVEKSRNLYNGPRYSRPQQQSRYEPPTATRNYQTPSRPQAPVSNNYKNDFPPTLRQYRNNLTQPFTPRRPYNPNFVPKPNLQREVSKNRTEDGRPICFKCNKPGHVARYCRVKFIRILEEDPTATQEKIEEKCQMNEISDKSGPRLYADASIEAEDGEYVIEENNRMIQTNGLRLARSLLTVTDRKTHIWITNPYPRPLKIMKDQTLAHGSLPAEVKFIEKLEQINNDKIQFQINKNLSPKEQEDLKQILSKYADLFSPRLGRTNLAKHRIDTEDAKPIKHKPYRVSPKERDIIKDQIDEMLKEGIIRPSSSPWSFPVILVKKRDGKFRFCVDYRKLNEVTVKDVYPIPRIDDVMDTLQGSKYFSAIDLRSGYWQVEIEEKDKEKTAFTTTHGLYEFNVMPFGLCNAPATFERNMDNVLGNLRWQICLCYLDDVIIYSSDFPTHLKRLEAVLKCFSESNLKLNDRKCRFAFEELEILGHITNQQGIKPAEYNIKAVRDFPQPKKVKEVQSFLGMCSYYRKFIKDFSLIADPLTGLVRKNAQFTWTEKQEEAFQNLKKALINPPILGHFDPNAATYKHTDASNIGLGATLVQIICGEEKVISYLSRTLSKAEQNYSTTEKECLAVVWAISKLRPYLYGRHFKIITDHHALCWLKNLKDPTGRLARWALKIQEYDFDIIHKSGKKHMDADGLSRGPLPETDWVEDYERLFLNQIINEEDEFIENVKKSLKGSKRAITQNFKEENGCLYKKNPNPEGRAWLLVVPKKRRKEIMSEFHNHMLNGHLGVARTTYRLKNKYHWPSMLKDVSEFVKTCHLCQSRKGSNQSPSGLLQPIPPANYPFERIGIDFVGPLPSTKRRRKWIIVLTDYYTRYAETKAVSEATVKEVSTFLIEQIFLRHGAPRFLISDRGSQFTSNLMKEVMKMCKVKHCFTTSYHPQTNGLTERLNRTLINMISMYVNTDQKNWDEILPFVTHAYNTTIQETTGYSPFFLLFGRKPMSLLDDDNMPIDNNMNDYDEYIENCLDKIARTRQVVINNTEKTQERMKRNYDKKHNERIYEPGHLVAVWTPVRKIGKCEKLLKKYFGPYRILKKLSNVNYLIEPKNNPGQDPLIVHVSRLKPYFERIDEVTHEDVTTSGEGEVMVETRSGKMQDPAQERIQAEESAKPQPGVTIGRDASSDPVVLNPNIDIPKYDGTEDPRPWIESLEEIGFLYHWADYIISRYAAMNMTGSAKTWLNLHKASFTSWENIKIRLIQDFSLDANKEELRMKLNRMQHWNEPAIRFAEDILVLCNKVDPAMEEETKIEHVIGGLKKEYSFALYLNPPKTTDGLLVVCKKMDSFEKKYRERVEKSRNLYNGPRYSRPQQQSRYVPPTAARNYQTTSRPQAPVSNNYKNDSHPTPRQYRNNFPQPSTPRRPYNPNFVPKPNLQRNTYNKSQEVSKNRTEDGRPICFKCNKPGHVARYCRVKFIRILEEDPADTQEKVEEKCQMNEISEKSGPRLYADIGTFEALVDTGADLSVVDLRTALDTGHGISKLAKICAGPDGKKLDMVGSIFLNIKIDDETLSHNFVILKTHLRTLILGRDFLKKMNAKIDCKQETIKYDLTNNHDEINFEMLKIKSAKDSIVPECSMKLIKALVETEDGEYIIEESSKMFQTNGLRLARSLINVINRETHIWITNPYPRPLKIMKNQTLAFGSSPAKINVSREREVEKNEEPRFQINENLSPKEQKELKQVLERYGDLFSSRLGRTNLAKHRIDTEDAKPIKHKPYRVSAKERDIIKEQIDEMLTEGIIRPSSSPWSFPVILVKKRDGKYRFCVDYRKLNNVTVKDVYPIPRIDEVMDTLQGSTHFSAIDLRSGYWQVEVEERDKEKTAFTTAHGLYEFNVMPFGLCNAPATFERNMENMLGNLRWQICLCYLDDVIIYSPDFPTHLKRLEAVFRCLRESNLRLNDKKCRFAFEELEILGYITSKHGIKPAEHNIKAVRNFPRPKKVKEVQSFLGMCSYYRKFIKDFSKIADPLTNLIKKSVSFTWTERQEEAFQTLKTALLSPPILGHFNPNAPTYVHTDASNIGIGATLVQDIGGEEKVISYLSRTLSKAEQNYSTTEKECLAVVWSMSKLRPYLYGRHFKIVTDHHALCWLKNLKDPTGRLARWALKIQEYDFDIIHKSGKKHLDADGLSRGPLPETDWDEDFERLFLNQITDEEDKFIESVKKNLNGSRRSIAQNFKEEDGCLFKKNPNPEGRAWLLVVPENKKREIMKEYHNHMSNGHLGVARTMYRIKSKYFWPSMLKDVSEFVRTCHLCQSRKGSNQLPSGLLQPIPPANFPFERIGIDFVGPLPSTKNRKKWIIVLSDYYTRYAETRAVSEATVKEVSKFLVEDIFLRHGAPQYLISDRGSQFTSNLMKEVMKTCKIKHCFTTSYHPQTNGLTERLNRTLINMLSMYVNTDQKNWDEILPFITHAYNTTIQETTGYSPFFLMFGREPTSLLDDRNISVDIDKDDYDEYIKHHLDKINRTRKLVINNTIKTQERMKKNYDKKHMERSYEPGELVAVWTPIRKIGKCEKLLRKYFGPYRILKKLSNVNYLIEPKDNPGQDPLIVHVSRIKPYFERIDEVNHED
ncbi:hypothetical protein LAZ67_5003163, partial [Cordylochernes scorpioides]